MNLIYVFQILIAVFLSVAILMQGQSGGLGGAFGGSSSYHTKRGVEKGVYYLTIILTVLFIGISLIALFQ